MGSFTYVSIAALFCYAFLFLTFLAAKKNQLINAYLLVLGSMLLWTGGSLLMRLQMFSLTKLWYDISILGLVAFVFAYLLFGFSFTGEKRKAPLIIWGAILGISWLLNTLFALFLAVPVPVEQDGYTVFLYEYTWWIGVLFFVTLAPLTYFGVGLLRHLRKNTLSRQQFAPFALGIILLALGHLLILTPMARENGIPFDLMAGILNAFCMFYGLYRRNLFRMTLLVSRGSCSALAGIMSILLFSQLVRPMSRFAQERLGLGADYSILGISLLVTLATLALYKALSFFMDRVFVREETAQAEQIREFSEKVSRSLNLEEILGCIVEVIEAVIHPSKIYIFIDDAQSGKFILCSDSNPLESKATCLTRDHPLVEWFAQSKDCLLMTEFRRSPQYKSIWQQERRLLERLEIECMAPLKDGNELVGIIMLSKKQGRGGYHFNALSLLDSINSISSIAVTNSRLYAKACLEARTDELTGLYNRKYFHELLEEEVEKLRGQSLALCLLSVDDLKLYNQLYGYKEGDQAIIRIAEIITGTVGEQGFVARHSGKLFAILLPQYDLRSAKRLADNIRAQVAQMHNEHRDFAIRSLTLSGGIAAIPYSASNAKNLFENADLALFHVKHNGKNAVLAYTDGDQSLEKAKTSVAEQRMAYSEYENTIFALMAAIDAKDRYTFNHSMNVLYYATKIAENMNMSAEYIEIIREAALLHDIGKIGIPEHILNKVGPLSPEEYGVMKGHVEQSITMIKFLPSLDYVVPTVIGHHERYDGKGYPRGLKGEDIPLGARILCLADSFDAMMSSRSYKEAYSLEQTLLILEEEAGRQFDPQLVHLFTRLLWKGEVEVKNAANAEEESAPV